MQWVPKNAWKRINITNRYGRDAVGILRPGEPQPPPFIADKLEPVQPAWRSGMEANPSENETSLVLQRLWRRRVPFIDLRDASEANRRPVEGATRLHHHDLLSGASAPIFPQDKNAQIVVFADGRQRAINGLNALRRQGYDNITVADTAAILLSRTTSGKQKQKN